MVRLSGVRIARHHAACRTVDTKPRRGILADDPVSDRFGRRRCLRPLRGCGKGGAVEFLGEVPFVRTERWGIGGFRYHWLCSLFRTLSQPLPVPENGTISLSRAQSSLLELPRREMEEQSSIATAGLLTRSVCDAFPTRKSVARECRTRSLPRRGKQEQTAAGPVRDSHPIPI